MTELNLQSQKCMMKKKTILLLWLSIGFHGDEIFHVKMTKKKEAETTSMSESHNDNRNNNDNEDEKKC